MSVDVVNTTTVPVKIMEGSGGGYRLTALVEPGKNFLLRTDMNLTYRQYLLKTEPENLPVGSILTSDDVLEYSKIEIKGIGNLGDPIWIGSSYKRIPLVMFVLRLVRSWPVKIVNCLTDQVVQIVEEDDREETPKSTKELSPNADFSVRVNPNDTHRYYRLTTDNFTVGRLRSDDIVFYYKIEITKSSLEYIWEGIRGV